MVYAIKLALLSAIIVSWIVLWPKVLVSRWGSADPWVSYAYHYGFGLLVFLVGLTVIIRSGACQFSRVRDRIWFAVLLGGFVLFATLHAVWIWLAEHLPFRGVA